MEHMRLIMLFHLLCDFGLQTRWMAENKSKSNTALLVHVAAYTIGLGALCVLTFGFKASLLFAAINGALHFCTDFCTSRISSYFHQKKWNHTFWFTIGCDQYIHFLCLFETQRMLL